MTIITINDLSDSKELARQAMAAVHGGLSAGLPTGLPTLITDEASAKGKANPGEFHFVHYYDQASPVLMK